MCLRAKSSCRGRRRSRRRESPALLLSPPPLLLSRPRGTQSGPVPPTRRRPPPTPQPKRRPQALAHVCMVAATVPCPGPRGSAALSASSGRSPPGGGCLLPGAPSRWTSGRQTDGASWAMNGRSAQPEHARKVVAPREAPASHTLSFALPADGGMGPGKAPPMGVDRGAGEGHTPPRPLSCSLLRPSAVSLLAQNRPTSSLLLGLGLMRRPGRSTHSGLRSETALARDPAARLQANCLRNSAEMKDDSDREDGLQ